MFGQIIRNPIETFRGYKNSDTGIALRGPLSQFFGAIYLKPIDDAFDANDVTYIRYMDDIVILCKTKRQLARCRRQLMNILQERKLTLSRKKTRMGPISTGFHFCGIDYPGTQTQNITRVESAINDDQAPLMADCNLAISNGGVINDQNCVESVRIKPHLRTIRNAREQVKALVVSGFSVLKTKAYLKRWCIWWVNTSGTWSIEALLSEFIETCYELPIAAIAEAVRQHHRTTLLHSTTSSTQVVGLGAAA